MYVPLLDLRDLYGNEAVESGVTCKKGTHLRMSRTHTNEVQ